LFFEEGEQVGAPEAAFPFATDAHTGQPTGIRPAPERGLANVEELCRLLDVEQVFVL
jgi:hypothetical protein